MAPTEDPPERASTARGPRLAAAALLIALSVILSACGAAPGGSDPSTTVAPTCGRAARVACVTPASGGHVVTVSLGWTVTVDLHSGAEVWSGLAVPATGVLVASAAPHEGAGTITARFRAAKVGHATLRALERPRCRVNQACPEFVVPWQVRITVRA